MSHMYYYCKLEIKEHTTLSCKKAEEGSVIHIYSHKRALSPIYIKFS